MSQTAIRNDDVILVFKTKEKFVFQFEPLNNRIICTKITEWTIYTIFIKICGCENENTILKKT